MKILFLSSLYYPHNIGGAEVTLRLLAKGAQRDGHDIVVVSLTPHGQEESSLQEGVRCIYLPLANVYWPFGSEPSAIMRTAWHLREAYNPRMGRRLGRVLDREKPDIVHYHNLLGFSAAAWVEADRRGIPIVQTLHDYYAGCANSSMYRKGDNCRIQCTACRVLCAPRRRYSRRVTVLTSVSHRVIQRLKSETGAFNSVEDIRIIRGCNIATPSQPPPALREEALKVGFLGRIERTKGIELLIESILRQPQGTVRLIVGGRGPSSYEADLRGRYDDPRIDFRGQVDPNDFFAEIDILCVPSLWEEPLARVLHEAFAFGVPVIGSLLGGTPEIVEHGRTGFLFRPENGGDLDRVLTQVTSPAFPWQTHRQACLAAAKTFELETVLDQYRACWHTAEQTAR